jgi:HEPN domain-containing protein
MSVPDKDLLRKVAEWVSYADYDIRLAEYTLTMTGDCPYHLVAYHAQQCVEKYLKAYLVYHCIDFPYTHDISELLAICAEKTDLTEKFEDAEVLTIYATKIRYPGMSAKVTEEKARLTAQIAKNVRETVRIALIQKGMNL